MRGQREDGRPSFSKNCKTPFFSKNLKFLQMGNWNWSKTTPVFFLFRISQQIQSLEALKVLAKMGRGGQAD